MAGPLHCVQAFDGTRFDYDGTSGVWTVLLASDRQAFALSTKVGWGAGAGACSWAGPGSRWHPAASRSLAPPCALQMEAGVLPGTTLIRAMRFKSGQTLVQVTAVRAGAPRPGAPPDWCLSVFANGQPVAGNMTVAGLPGGIAVTFLPGSGPAARPGTVTITSGALGARACRQAGLG